MLVMSDVTRILNQIEQGDQSGAEQLLPLVYDELRRLATAKLAHEPPGNTLQATALVHESYLRLVGGEVQWNGRGHFFGAAAEAMRRILVEQARRRRAQKRGGDRIRIDLPAGLIPDDRTSEKLLDLHEAISEFERESPQKAELVKLRFFAGLTKHQAAEVLGISSTTADRYWAYARAWLKQAMDEE